MLEISDLQERERRWVIADLCGKGNRIRTVAVPIWVKQAINGWLTVAELLEGKLFRSVYKGGKVARSSLNDWAVWSVVRQSAEQIGIDRFGAHDLRRTCAKLCRKSGGDLEQIKFLLGHCCLSEFVAQIFHVKWRIPYDERSAPIRAGRDLER
ncbi:MAG TPA: tyrosine-type recombinase/integrase [Edaphobacter sp.]|nr:tyrosine-type recombinase/integrase [Edaphobacter sp.]